MLEQRQLRSSGERVSAALRRVRPNGTLASQCEWRQTVNINQKGHIEQ